MAPANNPESAPVFFVGVKGDVTIKDETGNKIKLKKGDKIPVDARIIVGDGGKIVFKQENKTLKYESQGEASLSNALTESSDASQDPGLETLVEAAEQIITTPDRPSQDRPSQEIAAQQPLAKPVVRADASTLTPTPAKEGILEPPFIVPTDRKVNTQSDASEIVKEMAEQIAARGDALGASTTESEEVLSSVGETLTLEHNHKHIAHDETPLPPAAPAVTSFAPNTGSGDDNITSEKELTISGVAPTGTQVTLLCDDVVIKQGIQVSSQGQWSTQWNTGKDGSFTLTATASSGTASSAPSSAFSVQVDSKPPALEFDHPASDDNYNFVTYNKAAIITGTTAPGQTFTLTQGNNSWKITADDKGTWSQAVANLNDGLTEFSASMVSAAGVEVTETAKLLVRSTPYDFKIQPDTGTSDTDSITNSEDLLLTVKSQPDATVVLTILGKDIKSTVNKDGQAEFKVTLAGDDIYTCQLKTLYADNGGESDTVEESITLDTTPAAFNLDQLQTTYKVPDISFSGQCKENGSTVSIKLVNVFKPGVSVSTTATVENGTFNATATVPEQGQYRAEVTIVDAAGNTSFPQDYPFEYQPPKPELIIQTRPDDSSSNANPEWTGTFPHEGKLEISFAGKTDTITVKSDNTWSYQFSDAFDFARHTVTFTGSQAGLAGTAIEQDSFTVLMPTMQLTINEAPTERTNLTKTEWKGSGAAPNAKVTLTLTPTKGDVVEETVDADDQGFFAIALSLIEGSYSTALTATVGGYQDSSLIGDNVTIDRTGPVMEVDPGFKPIAGNNTMTGTATDKFGNPEPNGSVVVHLNNGQSYVGSIKAGHFSIELKNLSLDNTYVAEIIGSDDLNNIGKIKHATFKTPPLPTMSLTLDTEPADRIDTAQTQWKGSGAAPNATVTLTLKTTAQGSEIKNTVTADNKGEFLFKVTGLTETSYTPELSATASGYQDASLTGKLLTVDTTGPVLTLDPNVMTSLKATSKSLLLSGSSTDQNGKVTATLGSKTYNGIITGGHFTVKVTGLLPGKHYNVKLVGTDDVGNKGQEVSKDFQVPPLGNMSLKLDTEPADRIATTQTQWQGSGAAPDAKVTLTLKPARGSEITDTVIADNKGTFAFNVSTLTETSYTPELSATASGYQDASLTGKLLTVDTTGPVLTLDPNVMTSLKATSKSLLLSGSSTDQNGKVTATLGSKTYNGIITGGHFTVKVTGLLPGKHYNVKLVGTDDVGNKGQEVSKDFQVPPLGTMSLKLDTEPADRIATTQTQWQGSGAAPDAKVTLTLKPARGSEITDTVIADNKGTFAFNVSTLTETSYTPELSATASGYQDASLTGKLLTVDTTGPTVSIIPNFQLTAGYCTLKGKAIDQSGQPEPKGSVTVKVTGIPKPFTGTISNGDFSVQMDGLQPGKTYDLSLTATDELQNTGLSVEKSFSLPGVHAPQAYDFAVTSLKSDTDSIVIRGTHPLENGRVSVHLSSDIIKKAGSKNQGIITQSAKDHKWNLLLKNLFQDQEVTVRFKAMDDAGTPQEAKFLPDIAEIQDKLIIGGKRESYFDSLSAENGIGTYGKHICISYNKVRLGKTKFPSKYVTLASSNRADIEYKITFDSKLSKGKLLPEHYQPSKLIIKYHTLEQLDTDAVVSVESPSLHYTFDNFQPGQDSLVSQTYPATAKISGSADRVQGSIGSGLQLGKGVLQVEDFKDLFKGSYTICFDIKTSTQATKSSQLFPALAGYYDETSPTGAKTHLFGAFNEKGQIGVADHNNGFFAEPVVADNQWHSVCISRTLVSQKASTYRMLIDGKQADISKTGDSDVKKEQTIDHGTISNSPVSEYPVELLGGVTKSNSPDQVEYLNEAVLDNFTAYPISMETPYESSAYAHVHWNCSNGGACFYNSEFPAGLMIKEMMESRLTPHSPLYLQLKNSVANKSFTTSFTVKYQGKELDPQDSSVAGDNVYKLDSVSAKSLATVSVQPADPAAAHKFELHFDRTESDLIKGASMPDGIIKFDSSVSPLGSGISFGVGKNQSHSPSNKDPNLILEARHLVTEADTTINNYDIKHSIINLDGLQALKGIAQADDFSNKLLKLMSESSAESDANQVKLMTPCTQSENGDSTCTNNPLSTTHPTSKALTDKTCTTDTTDPLVTINTVENNPAIALQLNGEVTYYQHT
ncbi:Ig-like domain-containing protein [Endozoicomonas euniceicola]|uniref:Ig-like domain-containing protein n=1 Tax=Endozoicomonas euniceicola TaxID=1234143 RepID=A0ABY6GTJ8_9GAMM|nr:Ig-like domain-containing protein [Endozoicomonas euniceicola]UYM16085.1 Ig-like domain-containing protein [Endozoicomonas euniceicola]